ncbi:MAG: hypothetical protein J6T74_01780 [Clostridia bacterium]|nr:hypothetical protein [Clostridia bacterium]
MSDVLNTLIYMPRFNVIDFFYRLASTRHDCTKNNKYITIKNQDGNVILYPHITPSKITLLDFSNIIKNVLGKNIKRLVVPCVDVENNIITELDKFDFDIVFLKNEEIYLKLLKKYEFYPEIIIKNVNKSKNTLKFLTTSALNKKRTKGYFLSALCLFFASFFNAYKIYYICVSSILILLAIFSWFNIKFNTAKEIKLLD